MTSRPAVRPQGRTADAPYALDVDPERAGWAHCSLRVLELAPGGTHTFTTGDSEWIVLPLTAAVPCAERTKSSNSWAGRACSAESPTSRTCPATPGPRSPPAREAASPWQERSASDDSPPATAPRRRFPSSTAAPALRPPGAQLRLRRRLRVRPAHRRRGDHPRRQLVLVPAAQARRAPARRRVRLEEIYYFEIDGPNGLGYQRVSPSGRRHRRPRRGPHRRRRPGPRRLARPVHRAPGHTMYYLNVMAGPGDERDWRICFHPDT